MTIPFMPNVGFTEVSSAGSLNDKAGAKSKLPIQFFRLTDNISGNLSLSDDSAHKKIILDTNGNNITNASGSPLTTNSSTTLELKGSGNVQCTLKTFTASESSTSNTGTTTFSNSDSSTLVVAASTTDTTTTASLDRNFVDGSTSFGQNVPVAYVTWSDSDVPAAFQNANSSLNGGGNFTSGTLFLGSTSTSTSSAPSGNTLSLPRSCGSATSLVNAGIPHVNYTPVFYQNCASGNPFQWIYWRQGETGVSGSVRLWIRLPSTQNNRVLTFTNNLTISCVLSGADPYDGVTVSAGATAVVTRSDSTDGSFNVTGTISGTNGSSQPFALAEVNSGTGSINTSAYTGTLSASAL